MNATEVDYPAPDGATLTGKRPVHVKDKDGKKVKGNLQAYKKGTQRSISRVEQAISSIISEEVTKAYQECQEEDLASKNIHEESKNNRALKRRKL
jgi:hypothetical protein